MSNLKVHYWQGWIDYDNMNDEKKLWFDQWLRIAREAANNDQELMVFRIPKTKLGLTNGEVIEQIEKLLQDKFGKK